MCCDVLVMCCAQPEFESLEPLKVELLASAQYLNHAAQSARAALLVVRAAAHAQGLMPRSRLTHRCAAGV